MSFKLFDSHTHVQMSQFDNDRDEVIKRALAAGVWIINAGADNETSASGVEIANKYNEGVYATVGLHPTEVSPELVGLPVSGIFDYDFFKKLVIDKKVVAIGECGLEYFRERGKDEADKQKQKELFLEHIKLAHEVKKPLVIHCREAFPDLIKILQENNVQAGILHFFTGTMDDAEKLLNLGFYFTFGGLITFIRDYDEIIKFIPLERLLVETDAPFVAPVPYRGKRNEPAYVIEVAKKLAEIKEVSFEKVCEQTTENAKKVFGVNIGN